MPSSEGEKDAGIIRSYRIWWAKNVLCAYSVCVWWTQENFLVEQRHNKYMNDEKKHREGARKREWKCLGDFIPFDVNNSWIFMTGFCSSMKFTQGKHSNGVAAVRNEKRNMQNEVKENDSNVGIRTLILHCFVFFGVNIW